jgi:DNA-binding CsgD family transcriptional regulator
METWKAIPEIPYEVSSEGRVRRRDGGMLKLAAHRNGYRMAKLGKWGQFYAHRLVCRAFHGSPPRPDCHADHINGDRADNRVSNLRWLTPEENRALRQCARGLQHWNARLTPESVRLIRASTKPNSEIAAELGVHRRTVGDVRNRKTWSHLDAA